MVFKKRGGKRSKLCELVFPPMFLVVGNNQDPAPRSADCRELLVRGGWLVFLDHQGAKMKKMEAQ